MKTILWKELREHAFWVPLALMLTSITIWYDFSNQPLIFKSQSLISQSVFVAAIIATSLGVLQSWGDCRLESRALLLHRGITPSSAYYAKFLAGLLMFSLITIPPLVAVSIWIAADQQHTLAAYWSDVLPIMGHTMLAFMCWPASFLVLQRSAWWFGSRLLPLVCAYLMLVFCVVVNESSLEPESWFLIGVVGLTFLLLTTTACSAFVSLGKTKGVSQFFLGSIHGTCLLIVFSFFVSVLQQTLYPASQPKHLYTSYQITLGQDGDPVLIATEQSGHTLRKSSMAKLSTEGIDLAELKEVDGSVWAPSWNLQQYSWDQYRETAKPDFQAIGEVVKSNNEKSFWSYVYDDRSGEILVYSEGKQLAYRLTPQQASGEARFTALQTSLARMSRSSSYLLNSQGFMNQLKTRLVVAFDHGIYVLDGKGNNVTRLFEMPVADPLLAITGRSGGVDHGLRFQDRVILIQPSDALIQPSDATTQPSIILGSLDQKEYVQTSLTLPSELAKYESFQLAKHPESENQWLALTTAGDTHRWYRLDDSGVILEKRTYHQSLPQTTWNSSTDVGQLFVALLPIGYFGLPLIVAAFFGQGWSMTYWSFLSEIPTYTITFSVILALQVAVALTATYLACRSRGLTGSLTRRWMFLAFLGGPFVALGLLTVYPLVARQTCASCRKKVNANRMECENCNQPLDQQAKRGIEVFDDTPSIQPVPAHA